MRLTNLIRPVWKHGPRSLVLLQVTEKLKFVYTGNSDRVHRVMVIVSRAVFLPSKSINTGTRKMVNYTCAGLSQEKFCWRLEAPSEFRNIKNDRTAVVYYEWRNDMDCMLDTILL